MKPPRLPSGKPSLPTHSQPRVAQPNSIATPVKQPVAPAAYRPDKPVQVLQQKKHPIAPPAYRPQPVPKVLQMKKADGLASRVEHVRRQTTPPPVYRPQAVPKVLQTKSAGHRPVPTPSVKRAPVAPAAWRPQPVPKVLQTKKAATQQQPQPLKRPNQSMAQPTARLTALPAKRTQHKTSARPAIVARPTIQRAIIPVYDRHPASEEARAQDRLEVDGHAQSVSLSANSGTIRNDLATGGNLVGIAAPERIIIVGHGNVGSINGYSGAEVANLLKRTWNLPRDYAGDIVMTSCKSGDSTWYSNSLVKSVYDNLRGYSANVKGLKGNVTTGGQHDPVQGQIRSVGSDVAFARYKQLREDYAAAKRARDAEIDRRCGTNILLRRSQELAIGLLEMEQRRLQSEQSKQSAVASVFSSVSSMVTGSSTPSARLAAMDEEIGRHRVEIERLTGLINPAQAEVETGYHRVADPIVAELNNTGIALGNARVTVEYRAADRPPPTFLERLGDLGDLWAEYLIAEAEGRPLLPI